MSGLKLVIHVFVDNLERPGSENNIRSKNRNKLRNLRFRTIAELNC
jgi:hypothetical protein